MLLYTNRTQFRKPGKPRLLPVPSSSWYFRGFKTRWRKKSFGDVDPRNFTWNLKIMVFKWTFLFQGLIFRWTMLNFGGVVFWLECTAVPFFFGCWAFRRDSMRMEKSEANILKPKWWLFEGDDFSWDPNSVKNHQLNKSPYFKADQPPPPPNEPNSRPCWGRFMGCRISKKLYKGCVFKKQDSFSAVAFSPHRTAAGSLFIYFLWSVNWISFIALPPMHRPGIGKPKWLSIILCPPKEESPNQRGGGGVGWRWTWAAGVARDASHLLDVTLCAGITCHSFSAVAFSPHRTAAGSLFIYFLWSVNWISFIALPPMHRPGIGKPKWLSIILCPSHPGEGGRDSRPAVLRWEIRFLIGSEDSGFVVVGGQVLGQLEAVAH